MFKPALIVALLAIFGATVTGCSGGEKDTAAAE
jgi:hypothetical protein